MNCLLGNLSEETKARMAVTTIFLGLTPTVLSMLGSSTLELNILSTQRPFLALCLALASPAVWPMRPFQRIDMLEEMRVRAERRKIPNMGPVVRNIVTVLQYACVLASIGNVVSMAYELGWKTIMFAFSCKDRYGPFMWTVLAAAVHLVALLGFVSRLGFPSAEEVPKRHRSVYAWLKREVTPCISHERRTIIWRSENAWYLLCSLIVSTGTVAHMVLGIATLGSIQLMDPTDARTIVGRFLLSAVVCRCILMFELAGLRERLEVIVEGENEGNPVTQVTLLSKS
jgi:hypothetical protein